MQFRRQHSKVVLFVCHTVRVSASSRKGFIYSDLGLAGGKGIKHDNKAVLTSKRVSYHLKSKIFNTYVIPVVLYGLECVNWTSKSLQRPTKTCRFPKSYDEIHYKQKTV